MIPESILGSGEPGVSTLEDLESKLNFESADKVAQHFAEYNKNNPSEPIKMRGHVFVWHCLTA